MGITILIILGVNQGDDDQLRGDKVGREVNGAEYAVRSEFIDGNDAVVKQCAPTHLITTRLDEDRDFDATRRTTDAAEDIALFEP